MRLRTLVLATLLAVATAAAAQDADPLFDQWNMLAAVWNPFAEGVNKGAPNLKQWRKVVEEVYRIERCKCKVQK